MSARDSVMKSACWSAPPASGFLVALCSTNGGVVKLRHLEVARAVVERAVVRNAVAEGGDRADDEDVALAGPAAGAVVVGDLGRTGTR